MNQVKNQFPLTQKGITMSTGLLVTFPSINIAWATIERDTVGL